MGASFFAGLLIVVPALLFFTYLLIRMRYKKAGPDEALIVFGRRKLFGKKVRTVKGEVEGGGLDEARYQRYLDIRESLDEW